MSAPTEHDSTEAPATARLKVKVRDEVTRHVLEPDQLVTIGRSESCQLRVQDKSVSREHCVAIYTDGEVRLNDLRSTHGLSVDGERVDRCVLRPGDSCRIGNAVLEFEPSRRAAPTAAAAEAPERPAQTGSAEPAQAAASVRDAAPEPTGTETEDAPAEREPLPERIGNYRILSKLGEGGFGTVYRAEQEALHREVALKVLKQTDDEAQDPAKIAAFVAEARAAARVADPHLVQVFDVGEADGRHYLSMELVEGGSLVRRIRERGPLPWQEVLDLLHDMGCALAAAHDAGIVHRDVKPANILLARDGVAKLADLGMAANEGHGGTIAFMAPEQLRREPPDARSDLYALGLTAYAALAGRPPFQGTRQEIARAQVRTPPAPLQDLGVQVPWHLHQLIVDSLLAKSPADRPQSAHDLLDRLDRIILPGAGRTPAAPPSAPAGGGDGAQVRVVRRTQKKALGARIAAESIVVGIVTILVIATLLALKVGWDIDIYRLIGR